MFELGIGIITYNRVTLLQTCLKRILSHTKKPYKLIVADDGSTDGTIEFLESQPISYVTGNNQGVSTNKNRALHYLRDCAYIYLIEDDIYPINDNWEDKYIEAILESKIEYFSRTLPEWEFQPSNHLVKPIEILPNNKLTYLSSTGCPGQLYIITQNVLKKVGGLWKDFKGYGHGHIDWTYRIKHAGLTKEFIDTQIDVKEARDLFESPSSICVTTEEKKNNYLEKNFLIRQEKRLTYKKQSNNFSGDFLYISDKIRNPKYLIKNSVK